MQATFQALTDALVPESEQHGYGPHIGSADMGVHEYIIYGLNHYISIQQQLDRCIIPLAYPTAIMLDVAAIQLVNAQQAQPSSQSLFPKGRMFSYLSRKDRVRTLSVLENLNLDLYLLPSPYKNNSGLVKHVVDVLNRFSLFGYYSEWPAYGTTRLFPPDYRRLEFFPLCWQQVGYPGVSLGYRDFRGFLLKMRRSEG
ncbi:hypothetical protein [Tenuibacillus multivorans]|uniref:Uncharacterized protein n=1 Tax=Tenuibacillus multivorans TaxID=237069 RepID=A0A1G9ZWE3_9BACI|nr:hypothetical protein [Tenuibacillus multivorans]GEL76882.1 hypothetical protein TMU01_11170 [Tenuibacillus multivorans]SDN25749.1 hypothetical protein SAMN05216498_1874 [Tenuibacillus multivorans]